MNILVLGDVVGPSGVEAVTKELPKIIKEKQIDFVIYLPQANYQVL